MRVLYWTELFWPYIGGVEVLSTKLIPALLERGYEVIVVTSHDHLDLPDEARYKGIPVYRFPFRKALATRNLHQLMEARHWVAKLKRAFAAHLVHINGVGPSSLFHLHTREAYSVPCLVTMQNEVLPTEAAKRDTLLGDVLRSANWVTCVSAAGLAQVRQFVPEILPRSSVIYNFVHAPLLIPAPLPIDPPRLLCLGRLVPQKGFDLALRAFASLCHRFPRARLVIAGDGPARAALELQAAGLRLTHSVDFIGWVAPEKVPELMNTATVVVMPSQCEGFGLVALEAAMMARPVVATRVGGLPEVVIHQQTGLLVEQEDREALSDAIAFLLDHPEAATTMGRAGRLRAQRFFSLERLVDSYDALYRKLIYEAAHVGASASPPPH